MHRLRIDIVKKDLARLDGFGNEPIFGKEASRCVFLIKDDFISKCDLFDVSFLKTAICRSPMFCLSSGGRSFDYSSTFSWSKLLLSGSGARTEHVLGSQALPGVRFFLFRAFQ